MRIRVWYMYGCEKIVDILESAEEDGQGQSLTFIEWLIDRTGARYTLFKDSLYCECFGVDVISEQYDAQFSESEAEEYFHSWLVMALDAGWEEVVEEDSPGDFDELPIDMCW